MPPRTVVLGSRILAYDEVDSTNDLALRIGGDGTVVVADRQRTGRGRLGRSWHSAPGLGTWFSVALEGHVDGLGFAAALAVRDALWDRCRLTVKWPNDLLLNGRKVCGILVEHRGGRTALGVGINVHHRPEDFPEELRGAASSLAHETGLEWRRDAVLRDVLTCLDARLQALRAGEYPALLDEWAAACGIAGRRVRAAAGEGVVRRVTQSGALEVQTEAGILVLTSSDIVILNGA